MKKSRTYAGPGLADLLLRVGPPLPAVRCEPPKPKRKRRPPKPKRKRRPKTLSTGTLATLTPHQRHMGSLLRDIANISVQHPTLTRGFSKRLARLPAYKDMDLRTLRRDVAEALAWAENLLESIALELWPEFGIEPPATMSRRTLRKKALELLRHELLAKTP
jgi:hypothetical protein